MGAIYDYLSALFWNMRWLITAVVFAGEQLLGLLVPGYRVWVDRKFSKQQQWKFVKSALLVVLFFSGYLAWKEKDEQLRDLQGKSPSAYAEVSRDGTIVLTENFDEYGLSVRKVEFRGYPAYELTFVKVPDHIRVEPQENATRELVRVSSNVHRVRFIKAGLGNPTTECNFTVEAFRRK